MNATTNLKSISVLIAIGLVLGILVGFSVSKVVQGVKTVTKTKTVPVKITNGEPLEQVTKSFSGQPAAVTSGTETLPSGCAVFEGAVKNGKPSWIIVAC